MQTVATLHWENLRLTVNFQKKNVQRYLKWPGPRCCVIIIEWLCIFQKMARTERAQDHKDKDKDKGKDKGKDKYRGKDKDKGPRTQDQLCQFLIAIPKCAFLHLFLNCAFVSNRWRRDWRQSALSLFVHFAFSGQMDLLGKGANQKTFRGNLL